jgi:hypothetical protein
MAREYQTWNRGNNYYDTMLAQLMFGEVYPRGMTERKKVGGEWENVPIPPEFLPNTEEWKDARRRSKAGASAKEDLALKGALGRSRSRRKGERPGSYAMTDYPGLQTQIWGAESQAGSMPGSMIQSFYRMSPEQQKAFLEQRRQWAAQQREVLGLSPLGGGRRW